MLLGFVFFLFFFLILPILQLPRHWEVPSSPTLPLPLSKRTECWHTHTFQMVRLGNRQANQALSLGSYDLLRPIYYLEQNICKTKPVCFAAVLCFAICLSVQICNTDARLFAKDHTCTNFTCRRVNKEISTKPAIKRSLVNTGHGLCTVAIPSGPISSVWKE